MRTVLVIDIGTSSVRTVLAGEDLKILAMIQRKRSVGSHINAEEEWDCIRTMISHPLRCGRPPAYPYRLIPFQPCFHLIKYLLFPMHVSITGSYRIPLPIHANPSYQRGNSGGRNRIFPEQRTIFLHKTSYHCTDAVPLDVYKRQTLLPCRERGPM